VSVELSAIPTAGRGPPVPLKNSSVTPVAHLGGQVAGDMERQPEVLVEVAARLLEVDVGQARVVRPAGCDHYWSTGVGISSKNRSSDRGPSRRRRHWSVRRARAPGAGGVPRSDR